MIKVLIVDDSAVWRQVLSQQLRSFSDIEVIGTAADAYIARDKILALRPDVITLDIEMPRMDGLTFLKILMQHFPLPVIVFSAVSPQGSQKALDALAFGAVGVFAKPEAKQDMANISLSLSNLIREAVTVRFTTPPFHLGMAAQADSESVQPVIQNAEPTSLANQADALWLPESETYKPERPVVKTMGNPPESIHQSEYLKTDRNLSEVRISLSDPALQETGNSETEQSISKDIDQNHDFPDSVNSNNKGLGQKTREGHFRLKSLSSLDSIQKQKILLVGASTGGTVALEIFLKCLPADCPGLVVVQHMPEQFTASFAARLNTTCPMEVREARNGDRVGPGLCLIAPGNYHLTLQRSKEGYTVVTNQDAQVFHQRPSVEILFKSGARWGGKDFVGIILTGMGVDGARGLLELREAGAHTVAQDQQSSVVWGMPGEAYKIGAAEKVLPLDKIAKQALIWAETVVA